MSPGAGGEQRVPLRVALGFCARAGKRPLALQVALAFLQAGLPVLGLLAMQQLVDAVASGVAGTLPRDQAWSQALTATGCAADAEPNLAGSEWGFADETGKQARFIQFREDAVGGNLGCNHFTGKYTFEDGVLKIGPLASPVLNFMKPILSLRPIMGSLLSTNMRPTSAWSMKT